MQDASDGYGQAIRDQEERREFIRARKASKSKALKKKTESKNSIKSYQPDQMYSDAAMKRFSAKRKALGHDK